MNLSEGEGPLPLIGVVASPMRVTAQLVEATPFGRLRAVGRRINEDVDGPTRFVPLPVPRQLIGHAADGPELRAGQAWVESIANAIAKVTFGLRSGTIRLGVALDAHLDGRGRTVLAARGGARVPAVVEALETALRGRNIVLDGPLGRALPYPVAWARGEVCSAIGGLTSASEALVLVWDEDVSWVEMAGSEVVTSTTEPTSGRFDVGFAGLDHARRELAGTRPVLVAARSGDASAIAQLSGAADALGREAARRLLRRPAAATNAQRGEPWRTGAASRLVVGGTLGRQLEEPRLKAILRDPFEAGLAQGLSDREDAAMLADLIDTDGEDERAALLHVSSEGAAPVLGAASLAHELARQRSEDAT